MKEFPEVASEALAACVPATGSNLLNAEGPIGEKQLGLCQTNQSQVRCESLARLFLKEVLKARPAKPGLRGESADSQTLRAVALDRGESVDNSWVQHPGSSLCGKIYRMAHYESSHFIERL